MFATRNCKAGYSCHQACINRDYECHKTFLGKISVAIDKAFSGRKPVVTDDGFMKRLEESARLEKFYEERNTPILKKLSKLLPDRELSDETEEEIYSEKRVGRDSVRVTLEGKKENSYEVTFTVNSEFTVARKHSRKQKLEIAKEVQTQFEAMVKSLPLGTELTYRAYNEDGKGEMRKNAYVKKGFSVKKEDGEYVGAAIITAEGLKPSDFSEANELEIFYQIIYGEKINEFEKKN